LGNYIKLVRETIYNWLRKLYTTGLGNYIKLVRETIYNWFGKLYKTG